MSYQAPEDRIHPDQCSPGKKIKKAMVQDDYGEREGNLDLHIRFNRMMLGQHEFDEVV